MKAAFGLAGLLVTLGVIVYIMGGRGGTLDNAKTAIDARNKVDPQLKQLTGQNPDGTKIEDSVWLEPQVDGSGRFIGLLVYDIAADNSYAQHFGVKKMDLITQIGPMPLRDMNAEMAKAQMKEAAPRGRQIVVKRDDREITLPEAAAPGQPSSRQPKSKNSLQNQLDEIQKVR